MIQRYDEQGFLTNQVTNYTTYIMCGKLHIMIIYVAYQVYYITGDQRVPGNYKNVVDKSKFSGRCSGEDQC